MPKDPLSSLLFAALEVPSGADRDRFLDQSCGTDEELRSQLDALLKALPQAKGFLSSPEFSPTVIGDSDAIPSDSSVLQTLGRNLPHIVLDDSLIDGEPIIRPSSTELPNDSIGSRYQLQGEIARGGMGAILKGRDVDLGRNIAIKVLLEAHRKNGQVVQRFVEEAQIGGQLQHPGIAPVYQLGQFPDRRPFFTMKLVKGQTLAAILSEREQPTDERNRLMGIFEQVCQTMAYAHSRGVVHRDLKPANIMVGAFGEVQVMDWGLAKVLTSDEPKSDRPPREDQPAMSVIQTVRSVGSDPAMVGTDAVGAGETQMGSVMGTPAYMPPEQALGEVDRLDERSDVFGLGSILVEILTGKPVYASDDPVEVLRMASRGKLDDCFERLEASDADDDLAEIARQCLGLEPEDRPRTAGEVADQISGYLESVETRLRETELKRATDATRAVEERRRRKVRFALAASIVTLIGLASGGWMWISNKQAQQHIATTGKVRDSISTARLHQKLSKDQIAVSRLSELDLAAAEAKRAVDSAKLLPETEATRDQAKRLLAQVQQEQRDAREAVRRQEESARLKTALEAIRVSLADGNKKFKVKDAESFDVEGLEARYRNAFAESGYDFEQLSPEGAAKLIRDSGISETIISALDHWARTMPKTSQTDLARAWMSAGNWSSAAKAYENRILADSGDSIAWMALAATYAIAGDMDGYRRTCDQMIERFAGHELSKHGERVTKLCLLFPDAYDPDELPTELFLKDLDENLANPVYRLWYTNCRAMLEYRRNNPNAGLRDANAVLADSLLTRIPLAKPYAVLVRAMCEHALGEDSARGSLTEARKLVEGVCAAPRSRGQHDTAIALLLLREATEKIAPGEDVTVDFAATDSSGSLANLPPVVRRERLRPHLLHVANAADDSAWRQSIRQAFEVDDEEALVRLATAEEAAGQSPAIVVWLGAALQTAGRPELATNILRAAQEKHPADFWLNYELAKSLAASRKPEDALGYARTALAIRPGSTAAIWSVVSALDDLDQTNESLRLFKQMLARQDLSADDLATMAYNLRMRGRLKQSEACARKAISLQPDNVVAYRRLGRCLQTQERYDEAIQAAQKGVSFLPDPDEVDDSMLERTARDAFFSLGYILNEAEKYEESAEAYRKCIAFDSTYGPPRNNLGIVLRKLGRLDEAAAMLRESYRLNPSSRHASSNLLVALIRLTAEKGPRPEWVEEMGKLRALTEINRERRIAEYRFKVKLNPRDVETRRLLAVQLLRADEFEEAVEHAAIVAEQDPGTGTHLVYARALRGSGRFAEAAIELRKAAAAGPNEEHLPLAIALHNHAAGKVGSDLLPPLRLTHSEQLAPDHDWFLAKAIEHYELHFSSDVSDKGRDMMFRSGFIAALRLNGQDAKAEKAEKEIREAILAKTKKPAKDLDFFEMASMVRSLRTFGLENEAIELLKKFHEAQPDDSRIATQTGALLLKEKRYDEARGIGEGMIERDAHLADGYLLLARIHQARKQYAESHTILDRGIAEVSKSQAGPTGSPRRQAPRQRRPQPPTAGRTRRPQAATPPNSRLKRQKAIVYYNEGKFHEAIAEHRSAPRVPGRRTTFYPGLCLAMYELGDVEGAIKVAKDGLASVAPSARNALAWLYVVEPDESGRFRHAAEAVILAKRAFDVAIVSAAPAVYRNTLGLAYYRTGDYESALRELEASAQDLDNEDNWLCLAMTHWKLNNKEKALRWLAKAEEEQKNRNFFRAQRNLLKEARDLIKRPIEAR